MAAQPSTSTETPSVSPFATFTPLTENHPLLRPSKGSARPSADHEAGRPLFRTASSSTFGDEPVSISAFADALALELYRREPNPVMQTSPLDSPISAPVSPGIHNAHDTYAPLLNSHWASISSAFPISPNAPGEVPPPVVLPYTPGVPSHPPQADIPGQTSGLSSSPKSAAFLLCATLTLLERSTVMYDPPFRGEMGVEMAIRSRAVREKVQQRLVDLAVNILNEPMDGDQNVPSPTTADQEQDESVTVFWSEWTVSAMDPGSECAADILLRLLNGPFATRCETICYPLMAHPVLLASTDYVWSNGLFLNSSSWKKRLLRPSLLHFNALVFYVAWAILTFYVTLQSEFKHNYSFNPLTPRHGFQTFGQAFAWYLWLVFVLGHAYDCLKIYLAMRFPVGSGPPLLADTLIIFAVILRLCKLQLDFAYLLLSYSLPLLLLSLFVFPSTPSFSFVQKSRVPNARIALRLMTTRLKGLSQVAWYLVFLLGALGWAMSGDGNISNPWITLFGAPITVANSISPIESRTSIAGGILLGLVLAWMLGDAYGSAPRRLTSSDADGWEGEFGRMIALSARVSHLQATRLYLARLNYSLPPPFNVVRFFLDTIPLALMRLVPQEKYVVVRKRALAWSSKVDDIQSLVLIPPLFVLDSLEKIYFLVVGK